MKMKKFLALVLSMCMIFSMSAVVFAEGDGTEENPEILTELTGDTVTVTGGTKVYDNNRWTWVDESYEGYYYKYIVPNDVSGTIQYTFTVPEDSASCTMNIQNLSTGADLDIQPQYELYTQSVNASAGDVIQIKIMSTPTIVNNEETNYSTYTYPDLTLTWSVSSKVVGTSDNPEGVEMGWNQPSPIESVVVPGTSYFYSYKNEYTDGIFAICIDENATIDPHGMYPTIVEDDPTMADSMNELKPEVVLTNKTTNEKVKYSDGTTEYTVTNPMTGMGNSYSIIQIPFKAGEEILIEVSSGATGYDDGVKIVLGAFEFEPYGSMGNPHYVNSNNVEIEVEPYATSYSGYWVRVSAEYAAQFTMSVDGEGLTVYSAYDVAFESNEDITLTQLPSGEYLFYVINEGDETATYEIVFDIPLGHQLNPEVLDVNDEAEYTFEIGDDSYYYYEWTAESDGIVYITVDSDLAWKYTADNTTSNVWGDYVYSWDPETSQLSFAVKEGDVLSIYVSAADENYEVTDDTTVTTTVEFVASEGGVLDSEVISGIQDEIFDKLDSGEFDETGSGSIVVDMRDEESGDTIATVIPGEVLADVMDALENYDIELSLEVVMDYYVWHISNVTSANPVDLGITFDTENIAETLIESIANGNEYATFTIAHNGNFGFDAVLEFNIDTTYAGKTAALYWNNNGTLELVGEKCTIAEDGTVSFDMEHASDYVLIVEGTATVTPPVVTPPAGDGGNTGSLDTADMAPIAMLIVVAAVAAVVVLKKRTVED